MNPSTSQKGSIHATRDRVTLENGDRQRTLCGRWLRLVPLEFSADGDKDCVNCARVMEAM